MSEIFFLNQRYARLYRTNKSFDSNALKAYTVGYEKNYGEFVSWVFGAVFCSVLSLPFALLAIHYINRIKAPVDLLFMLIMSCMPSCTIGFGMVSMWYLVVMRLWTIRRYRRLLRHGQILDGEVIYAENINEHGHRTAHVTVTYTFTTPQKRELIRHQRDKRGEFLRGKLPRKGTPVKVLYADDNACVML